jgi:hypothetical protein
MKTLRGSVRRRARHNPGSHPRRLEASQILPALAERAVQLVSERALIAQTIRGLRAGDILEATVQAICRQVANLTGIAAAQFLLFELDGYAMPRLLGDLR